MRIQVSGLRAGPQGGVTVGSEKLDDSRRYTIAGPAYVVQDYLLGREGIEILSDDPLARASAKPPSPICAAMRLCVNVPDGRLALPPGGGFLDAARPALRYTYRPPAARLPAPVPRPPGTINRFHERREGGHDSHRREPDAERQTGRDCRVQSANRAVYGAHPLCLRRPGCRGKRYPGQENPITAARVARMEASLGPSFWAEALAGARIIAVNSSLFGSGLPQERMQWGFLESLLARPASPPTVLLAHDPPYISAAAEPGGNRANIEPKPRTRLLKLLARGGGVRAILSGSLPRPPRPGARALRLSPRRPCRRFRDGRRSWWLQTAKFDSP